MLTVQGLQLAWAWLKKYAWIIFAVLAGVLAIILFQRSPSDLADQINEINKRHAEEIRKILKEHGDDPDALAAELAEVLGLQVQKP